MLSWFRKKSKKTFSGHRKPHKIPVHLEPPRQVIRDKQITMADLQHMFELPGRYPNAIGVTGSVGPIGVTGAPAPHNPLEIFRQLVNDQKEKSEAVTRKVAEERAKLRRDVKVKFGKENYSSIIWADDQDDKT